MIGGHDWKKDKRAASFAERGGTFRIGLLVALSLTLACPGQNLLLNPGFEEGRDEPANWRLAGGAGQWSDKAHRGHHALRVEGRGEDQSAWHTAAQSFTPGGLYRLRFFGRGETDGRGTAVSGTSRVNRDFQFHETWRPYSFVFRIPDDASLNDVHLGQWHAPGSLFFDDAELLPVLAVHRKFSDGLELGEAERIQGGMYRFTPNFGWNGANVHRPLSVNRAGFNSDRWLFQPGAELVYRLGVGDVAQTGATLRVAINYHIGGDLRIEASRSDGAWQTVTNFDGQRRSGRFDLPAALFPAREILIRLSQQGPGGGFQVNTFDYEAGLARPLPDAQGTTHFLEVVQQDPQISVRLDGLEQSDASGQWHLDLMVTNRSGIRESWHGSLRAENAPAPDMADGFPDRQDSGRMRLSCPMGSFGTQRLRVLLADQQGRTLFAGTIETQLGLLSDRRPGYWLTEAGGLGVWWCESGWKVGRDRGPPDRPADGRVNPVGISLARGEFEPVQVVLRPDKDAQLLSAGITPVRDSRGQTAAITGEINEVAYVNVTHPTDSTCTRGWYPDPLPPLRVPLALRTGQNQPLWLTFHCSRAVHPGDYRAELDLNTSLGTVKVPIVIQVYDFVLPEETHLKSALGLGTHAINRYHKLTRPEDQQSVFEKYLHNFAAHRISPYSFADYAPMRLQFAGQGTNKRAQIDFTAFDKAASKWLDEYHFNTFRLPLRGMGGGTFHSRHLGQLEGFEEGSPEHARLFRDYLSQVESHLRERGWLSKAYVYWFDEPDPKDYDFVIAGMKRIHAAAPGLRRMLTEQPEEVLLDHVDIWCGLTPEWTPQNVRARRDAGQEVWWYICTGPKAPYVTEFIDHPGTELRLWPWQSWQYGVEGILIWATVYWTSPAAFPGPRLQDPWDDPMSYVSGYDYGAGHVGYWGNGDGRFLYPPRRDPEMGAEPNLDAPINSIRWENLRDGMEDYEYFWLLAKAVEGGEKLWGDSDLLKKARELLTVPPDISEDLTHFTTDPRLMLAHRHAVARMIERLKLEPSTSRDP